MRISFTTCWCAIAALILVALPASAQDVIEHNMGTTSRAFHSSAVKVLKSTPPSDAAVATVNRIMDAVGLKTNFSIRASEDVANAEAIVENDGKDRYVLYNPTWLAGLMQKIDTSWAETSILAHEIGHQLQFHMDPRIGNYEAELEADRWSGFVLQRLGAPIEAAQLAMAVVASDAGSATHPPKADRLRAIAEGWKKAAASSPSSGGSVAKAPPVTVPAAKPAAPGLDTILAQCIVDPLHPAGADIADRLAAVLSKGPFQYGWLEESHLAKDSPTPITREIRYRLRSAEMRNGELSFTYDWQNGRARLMAVAPPEIATRGLEPSPSASFDEDEDRRPGARFQGVWIQDNGYGCLELHIRPDGQADGSWGIKSGSPDAKAFIKGESASASPEPPAN